MGTTALLALDIDGVIRDVGGSYRRALADTVEHFTQADRPTPAEIDRLKAEGQWNNDWEASQELIYRYFEQQGRSRDQVELDYDMLVDFFQRRYRGENLADPSQWNGYISHEPLLVDPAYFAALTHSDITWGFFSGATPGSAHYVLERRLGLSDPVLVAMDDAPGKPDPTGLFLAVQQLEQRDRLPANLPVIYAGDTVADMHTIVRARQQAPRRMWLAVGILPPHAQITPDYAADYAAKLTAAGATTVLPGLTALTGAVIQTLVSTAS